MAVKQPPRLLHVFPSFEVGGVQVRTSQIINGLGDRFDHSIIALNGNYACAGRLSAGPSVTLVTETKPARSFPRSLCAAARTIADISPDLLLTYNWAALDWSLANATWNGRAHIHHEDGFNVDEAERQFVRRVVYRRLSLWRTDLLVVPSHNLFDVARRVWKRSEAKIRLIPNGIDCFEFASATVSSATDPARPVVLGTLAPLRAEKNIAALLRVAATLRERRLIELVIVGDGPERSRLEGLAAELGLSDICAFRGLRDDIARELVPVDIFVMPSLTEQMPISLLQAMASAKPVVAYDVGDIARIISPENAPLIVARNDEAALTHQIDQLISDAPRRASIGGSNRAHVATHYTATAMIDTYALAYSETLDSHR